MEKTMIERVARVLCRQDSLIDPGQAWIDTHWREWSALAGDVIEAMEDPTPQMRYAGRSSNNWMGESYAEAAWRAMIAAALIGDALPDPQRLDAAELNRT